MRQSIVKLAKRHAERRNPREPWRVLRWNLDERAKMNHRERGEQTRAMRRAVGR